MEVLTEDWFWEIIDLARRPTGTSPKDQSAVDENLKKVLAALSDEDVSGFTAQFVNRQLALNKWSIWGAGYVIAGGMSDDSFHYFLSWIIGKGRACYDAALNNPDSLGDFVKMDEEVDNELLEYAPIEILEDRGLPDPRDFAEGSPDASDPTGDPFDEDTVFQSYPRLNARFGFGDGSGEPVQDGKTPWWKRLFGGN